MNTLLRLLVVSVALHMVGCATSYDYTRFRQAKPRSILVLPPINESTDVMGTYGYLTTVTQPLSEMGYYVFPVEVIDRFLKENGMPTAGEMQQIPLGKAREILGADAVMYITLKQYGSQYQLISTSTTVWVNAKLVDARTGDTLWDGTAMAKETPQSSGNFIADIVAAAVTQAINKKTDAAHNVSKTANARLFAAPGRGVMFGPYHPKYGSQ
jgi:hypothetical protein